jgi:arsenite/tail-anchored protein-transporting ATPase
MATRVIIYSGKGGTGKTTVSAATAALIASQGKRVLIMSSDPAHSLSDVVGQNISRENFTQLAPNLFGLEVDTVFEMRRNMSGFQNFVINSYEKHGVQSSVAAELSNQPGMDEILSLNRLLIEHQSGRWDCIIVDTAPTGNTLRLLAYPEMIIGGSTGKNFMKVYRGFSNFTRPFKQSSGNDDFYKEVNKLMDMMNTLSNFIVSEDVSVRLVLNPEKLPLMETKRAYTFLSLYGIHLDAVVVNKILPKDKQLGAYFDYWVELQAKYCKEINDSFAPIPILHSVMEDTEPIGVNKLLPVAQKLFGQYNASDRLYENMLIWLEEIPQKAIVSKLGTIQTAKTLPKRRLCVYLPFVAEDDELSISHEGTEICVTAGRIQRFVSLPQILLNSDLKNFYYEENTLKLEFEERPVEEIVWEDDPFFVGKMN